MTTVAEAALQMSGLEFLRFATAKPDAPPYIGSLLGMQFDVIEHGRVRMRLRTRPDFSNPLGTLHGGICATLLDSAMGCSVQTTLEAGIGYGTLELKVNYIRAVPVDGVDLIATATVIHAGRRTATAEGRVHDDQGRLVAHGTTTCMIYR